MDLDHQLTEAINSIAKKNQVYNEAHILTLLYHNLCIITSFISGIRFAVRELNQIKLIKEIIGFSGMDRENHNKTACWDFHTVASRQECQDRYQEYIQV